ncbi:hypothetical protein CWC22_014770 [Pseudoalteromonas rubra]|uniref:Potassium channel domain-containing protein n=1 Tax=Pseudoalteromonas rubra TaxID=43658 RepID=A0A5S3UV08_9GAMM|nr:potassium channel family protein [Pseudoalteromonas rubra]QPB84184.1 hypothetical protein CWC22_014770 [Pseudoalteromonas rubra]
MTDLSSKKNPVWNRYTILKVLFSFSRFLIDYWKNRRADEGEVERKEYRGKVLRAWSKALFIIESFLAVAFLFGALFFKEVVSNLHIYWHYALLFYAYCRVNEIAFAFMRDLLSKLKDKEPHSNIRVYERVLMALRSYFGLALNFSILFYSSQVIFLLRYDVPLFTRPLEGFFDSLYFSVVTITTLGYGDVHPSHLFSKLLVMYEVFTGLLLLAVAFAIYIGQLEKNKVQVSEQGAEAEQDAEAES